MCPEGQRVNSTVESPLGQMPMLASGLNFIPVPVLTDWHTPISHMTCSTLISDPIRPNSILKLIQLGIPASW